MDNMTTYHSPKVDAVGPAGGITPAHPLGLVDAELHDLHRQVSTLRTIEEVRALRKQAAEDWLAGRIDHDEHHRTLSVASLASLRLSESVVIEGCPAWCNSHNFSYGDQAEDDVNLHHHIVEGEGWKVELEEGCSDTGGSVQLIGACGEEIPLSTARAYAMALLAACDSVEGFTTAR
jgi:hypothetical protein